MARLSNEELKEKSINELIEYANSHSSKEACRVAKLLGTTATSIVYKSTLKNKLGVFECTFKFSPQN